MTDASFTPPLGRLGPTRVYDAVIALTRERVWRALVAEHVAPRPGEVIVDVGCGTGSQALLLRRLEPRARIIGVDPDADTLSIARRKAAVAGVSVDWRHGMGDALATVVDDGAADTVVSSLVLHQCPMEMKQAILRSGFEILRPGGKLVIADYGQQRTRLARLGFRLVQLADGRSSTRPNAEGVLPELMSRAGFSEVREPDSVSTVSGSISIYVARRR
ncbi:MAG: class I SAM-dependent methyltransferase [Stackebrandtia sp.]